MGERRRGLWSFYRRKAEGVRLAGFCDLGQVTLPARVWGSSLRGAVGGTGVEPGTEAMRNCGHQL